MNLFDTLAEHGLSIRREGQQIIVKPAALLTDELRALILERKPELLALLSDEGNELIRCHKADLLQAAELKRLVRSVGTLYGFTEAKHQEALEVALADLPAALRCFREIASKRGLAC